MLKKSCKPCRFGRGPRRGGPLPWAVPLLAFALVFSGCAAKRQPTLENAPGFAEGQLVLPNGAPAPETALAELAQGADYILIGERHDNAGDHLAQAALIEAIAGLGKKPAIGLEMLPRRLFNKELRAFSKGGLEIAALPEALDWAGTWGFDFSIYRPIFEAAKRNGLAVYGLNFPNALRRKVSASGIDSLSAFEKRALPREIVPPLPEQREKLTAFFKTHRENMSRARPSASIRPSPYPSLSERLPTIMPALSASVNKVWPEEAGSPPAPERDPMLERFLFIQSLWDSTMAEEAVRVRAYGGPLIILAGGGHVEYGWGIARRLKIFDPKGRVLLIMPFSGDRPEAGEADLFYHSAYRPGSRKGLGLALESTAGGVRVSGVMPGSRADKAGFQSGDIILRLGREPVKSPADLHRAAMQKAAAGETGDLLFTVKRRAQEIALRVGGDALAGPALPQAR